MPETIASQPRRPLARPERTDGLRELAERLDGYLARVRPVFD